MLLKVKLILLCKETFTDPNLDVFSLKPNHVPVSPDPYNMQVALAANSEMTVYFADYHNLMLSANVSINTYSDLNGELLTIHEYLASPEVGTGIYSMAKQTCFALADTNRQPNREEKRDYLTMVTTAMLW